MTNLARRLRAPAMPLRELLLAMCLIALSGGALGASASAHGRDLGGGAAHSGGGTHGKGPVANAARSAGEHARSDAAARRAPAHIAVVGDKLVWAPVKGVKTYFFTRRGKSAP